MTDQSVTNIARGDWAGEWLDASALADEVSAVRALLEILAGVLALLMVPVLLFWALVVRMPGHSYDGALPPAGAEEIAARQRLEADVRELAGSIGERSVWRPDALERARGLIGARFRELGYDLREDGYESEFESFGQTVHNLEATVPGSRDDAPIVLIGAHYDSVRGTVGADDNGSGVAALLELARSLRRTPLSATLRFVAFVNEEPPFFNIGEMGSQRYAAAAAARGDRIVAMLALETIGRYSDTPGSQRYPVPFNWLYPGRGNFIAFVGDLSSARLVRRSIATFRASTPFPSQGVAAPTMVPGIAWSDHASFWPFGVPAIMVTDTAPFRNEDYHTPADLPGRLDYDRMARVVVGLETVVRDLAGAGRE
jgi:hypothetical protein